MHAGEEENSAAISKEMKQAGRKRAPMRSDPGRHLNRSVHMRTIRMVQHDPGFRHAADACRWVNIKASPTPSNSAQAGTRRAGVIPPIKITPTDLVPHDIRVAVGPPRLPTFRLNLIADLPASDAETHR